MSLILKTEADAKFTIISNQFIDVYLLEANDAQIKVYLYLYRMLASGMETSVSEVSDKFNFTEKDVVKALEYWQRKQLLELEYDSYDQICGVVFKELTTRKAPEEASKDLSVQETRNTHLVNEPVKVIYTSEQLKEFAKREDVTQIIYIAETYLGRALSFDELNSILHFRIELELSEELIEYLFEYCISMNKSSFPYMEKVAVNWYRDGIQTPEQAKEASLFYQSGTAAIMKALGKNSMPAPKETEMIRIWTKDYCFTQDIILEACNRAVLATDRNRFSYADSVLKSWKDAGVTTLDDVTALSADYKSKDFKPENDGIETKTRNPFNQFPQNQYDFEALEKELQDN